ncbi:MAG: hypothetical protein RL616_1601 [Verrucomicrobiota bacterium]
MTRTSGKPASLGARPSTLDQKFALVFGLFLGLCIWKFGNPVILDHKISAPTTPAEFLDFAWPPHWANWILLPLAIFGGLHAFKNRAAIFHPPSSILCFLPLLWLGWQFISATQTADAELTAATLWQFSGCVACYFLGATLFAKRPAQNLLFIGLLAAFTFCLVRAVDQHLFEFPLNHQLLVEGERSGWTNFPSATMDEMKRETIVITTNGLEVANPVILKKFASGRVSGTLVYPNALAGLILLLLPVSLALAFGATQNLRPPIRFAAIALVVFLGAAAFFWTGSKLGWLIGLGLGGLCLLRLDWPKKLKLVAIATVFVFGLGIFTVRFHNYFSAGATSVGARFDYWRAAAQTTSAKPAFGTGPGTFQRPYAQRKAPDSEMARLTHNDFLEQFSDSGIVGGLAYAGWIILALSRAGKTILRRGDTIRFAVFIGVLAWFAQGFGEFGLYIPAPAWVAFTLLGCLISPEINEFDKKTAAR